MKIGAIAPVRLPDGTAAAPSIAFASDTDTGLYSPGAGQLSISINGAQQFRFQATGIFSALADAGQFRLGTNADTTLARTAAGIFLVTDKINFVESTTNPSAANLTSGADAKDRMALYMKADKLVFAYNAAGTVTYLTIPLDGSTTTWTHGTSAP